MKVLGFYPYPITPGKDYTDLIIDSIRLADKDIIVEPFSHYKIILQNKKYDLVWLNWYESLPSNIFKYIYEFIAKVYIIEYLKLRKVKIISVFHDRVPHDAKFPSISKWLLKFLLRKSDVVLVLNEASKTLVKNYVGEDNNKKIFKLPHPVYPISHITKQEEPSKEFNVLFFGYLKPYKNIEGLIELAKINPEIRFIIAGKVINKKYANHLKVISNNLPNVNLILRRLTDSELGDFISNCKILVLPYKMNSSINSGVMFYAFSHKKNVIIPHLIAIDDFKHKNDIFWYNYESDKDHIKILNKKLREAYVEYMKSPELFQERAERLYNEVKIYSTEYLADIIKKSGIL